MNHLVTKQTRHYQNGRKPKLGDKILFESNSVPVIGIVGAVNTKNQGVELQVFPVRPSDFFWVGSNSALHCDDALRTKQKP